eukprot:1750282-Prymnesium_polylepis.1
MVGRRSEANTVTVVHKSFVSAACRLGLHAGEHGRADDCCWSGASAHTNLTYHFTVDQIGKDLTQAEFERTATTLCHAA